MNDDVVIILASASPRREELLRQIGIDPVILPADIDENIGISEPSLLVETLAQKKGIHTVRKILDGSGYPDRFVMVIAADTIVTQSGVILGKPADDVEAFAMLKDLSGSTHEVLTGVSVSLLKNGQIWSERSFVETTQVHVFPMTDDEIRDYIATGEPSDKAGAYGIQGVFAKYISGISGNYANVVGLPVSTLYQTMKGMLHELQ